jgi:hypothetical protein
VHGETQKKKCIMEYVEPNNIVVEGQRGLKISLRSNLDLAILKRVIWTFSI